MQRPEKQSSMSSWLLPADVGRSDTIVPGSPRTPETHHLTQALPVDTQAPPPLVASPVPRQITVTRGPSSTALAYHSLAASRCTTSGAFQRSPIVEANFPSSVVSRPFRPLSGPLASASWPHLPPGHVSPSPPGLNQCQSPFSATLQRQLRAGLSEVDFPDLVPSARSMRSRSIPPGLISTPSLTESRRRRMQQPSCNNFSGSVHNLQLQF